MEDRSMDDTKVIGYFAFNPPVDVLCDGDACVVAGSEDQMKGYIESKGKSGTPLRIKKTRYGEIARGLSAGAAYAFDEESYNRFYPIANRNGYSLSEESFPVVESGFHFVVIRKQFT